MIAGIETVVRAEVPIIGEKAAENSVKSGWYILDYQSKRAASAVVSLMSPSVPASFAHPNDHAPPEKIGTFTTAEGRIRGGGAIAARPRIPSRETTPP